MVDAMRQEHVILLNEQGQPCGTLEKYAAHTATTPLHSAFSCWIFNEQGQLLVTRRSLQRRGRRHDLNSGIHEGAAHLADYLFLEVKRKSSATNIVNERTMYAMTGRLDEVASEFSLPA
jgi:hypothetical protein